MQIKDERVMSPFSENATGSGAHAEDLASARSINGTGEAKEQVRHRGETVAHVAGEACGSFLPVSSILFPGK